MIVKRGELLEKEFPSFCLWGSMGKIVFSDALALFLMFIMRGDVLSGCIGFVYLVNVDLRAIRL
jgi:hypothetical protein